VTERKLDQVKEINNGAENKSWSISDKVLALGATILGLGVVCGKPKITLTGLSMVTITGGVAVLDHYINKPRRRDGF